MHEIFISYSSKHRPLTAELAAALEQQYGAGSVWWDTELEARAAYATQIRAALEQSRVVVVLWTAGAMVSDYVYAEAQRALESGKLVNVRPADMSFRDIPEPFNIHHIDDAEESRPHPRHGRQGLERHADPDPGAAARDLSASTATVDRPEAREAATKPQTDGAAAGEVRRSPLCRRHRDSGRATGMVH